MGGCDDKINMKMQPEELDMVFEPLGERMKHVVGLSRSGGIQALKIRDQRSNCCGLCALLKQGKNFWVVIQRLTTQKERTCHPSAN